MTYIKEKFLQLTKRTYPHGTEKDLYDLLSPDLNKDEFGNLFIKIGDSDVMFTSHLDTATSALEDVVHVIEGNIIKTDGKTILGADDKAGVAIMCYMIENKIPGLYYFFIGEEVGCIGSKKVSEKYKSNKVSGINKVISFDRRDNDSVITYQGSQRTCSNKFADELVNQLNSVEETFKYRKDDYGGTTDSLQFISLYSECTNISVGYKSHHTFSETQDINHLEKLGEACLKIDWNKLPFERDPSKSEYKSYNYNYWENNRDYYNNIVYTPGKSTYKKTEKVYFHDEKYNYVSCIEIDVYTKKITSVELCEDRIHYEKMLIEDLLLNIEMSYDKCTWDGFKLNVFHTSSYYTECDRNDIITFLPEMDYYKTEKSIRSENATVQCALPPHNEDHYYYGD